MQDISWTTIRGTLLPSCLCRGTSVLRTFVVLSLVRNHDRWRISYISLLLLGVSDSCKPGLFGDRLSLALLGWTTRSTTLISKRFRLIFIFPKMKSSNDQSSRCPYFCVTRSRWSICSSSRKECFKTTTGGKVEFSCNDSRGLFICIHSSLITNGAAALWWRQWRQIRVTKWNTAVNHWWQSAVWFALRKSCTECEFWWVPILWYEPTSSTVGLLISHSFFFFLLLIFFDSLAHSLHRVEYNAHVAWDRGDREGFYQFCWSAAWQFPLLWQKFV